MGLWTVPDSAHLVGYGVAVAAGLAALDLILAAVGLLPTYWARRRG